MLITLCLNIKSFNYIFQDNALYLAYINRLNDLIKYIK